MKQFVKRVNVRQNKEKEKVANHRPWLINNSTRLFFFRPSSEVFTARGFALPIPNVSTRLLSTPFLIRYSATTSARLLDNVRLCPSFPVLSVWPEIFTDRAGCETRYSTMGLSVARCSLPRVDLFVSNRSSAPSTMRLSAWMAGAGPAETVSIPTGFASRNTGLLLYDESLWAFL